MARFAYLCMMIVILQGTFWIGSSTGSYAPVDDLHRVMKAVEWDENIVSQTLSLSGSGIPHIAYIRTNESSSEIIHSYPAGGEWMKEVVWTSSGSDQGLMDLFMVIEGEIVYISFTYVADPMMVSYLATRTDGIWKTKSLGLDQSVVGMGMHEGRITVLVGNYTSIQMIWENGTGWDREMMIDYGESYFPIEVCAGIPAQGAIRLVYSDQETRLHLVFRTAGGWYDTILHDMGNANYDTLELYVANDHPLIIYRIENRYTRLLVQVKGIWSTYDRGDLKSVSGPVTGPDGKIYFLEFSHRWGMNLTSWKDGIINSTNLFSDIYLDHEISAKTGIGRYFLEWLDLAISRNGIPHLSFINNSLSQRIEYSTYVDELPDNEPPEIGIEADPPSGIAPLDVIVRRTGVMDPDGSIVATFLYFGGSQGYLEEISEDVAWPGNYTAYALAWDDDLAMTVREVRVRVLPSNLSVRIQGDASGMAPYETVLTAIVTGATGNISEMRWTPLCKGNFTQIDPFNYSCRFEEPGDHLIFVSVKDEHGSESLARITIRVSSKEEGPDLLGSAVPVLALLLVPILFWAAAMLAMGIVREEGQGQERPRRGQDRGPGSARGRNPGRGAPPSKPSHEGPRGPRRA